MKLFACIIAFCFVSNMLSFSQDLLVTGENDSINCKINRIDGEFIYFSKIHNHKVRSTYVSLDDVKCHQTNYFVEASVSRDSLLLEPIKKVRIALSGGYSMMVTGVDSDVPDDVSQHIKSLKAGYNVGLDINYFVFKPLGFGLKYNVYKSSSSSSSINYKGVEGMLNTDVSVSFLGPSVVGRLLDENNENPILIGLSFGYMNYINNESGIYTSKITQSTWGGALDLGVDIYMSKYYSVGCKLSYLAGWLPKESYGVYSEPTIEDSFKDLSRLDFSLVLVFNN